MVNWKINEEVVNILFQVLWAPVVAIHLLISKWNDSVTTN